MKLKGVNPFEQHVEKIVLVAVSAIFLIVLAAQFLLEPNRVKVGSQELPPGRAFEPVEQLARSIESRMTAADLDLPPVPPTNLVEQFTQAHGGPVSPRPNAVYAFGPATAIQRGAEAAVLAGDQKIQPVTIPPPANVVAAVLRNTISPTEPLAYPDLKKFLPEQQPYDKAVVSVEARFNGEALRSALAAGGDGFAPIPAGWYRDSLEIVGVRLERQEQTGPGQWGEVVEVPAPPALAGEVSLAEQLKTVASPTDLADVAQFARENADFILRPAYYQSIAGPEWAPPSVIRLVQATQAKGEGRSPEVERFVREIARIDRQLEALTTRRQEIESTQVRTPGGGGGGGKGGGMSPPSERTSGPTLSPQEKERRLRDINNQIQRAETERTKAVDALKTMGLGPDGLPLRQDAQQPAGAQPGTTATLKPLLDNPDVQLWAHDLTAQPGKVYRYRLRVEVTNPVFGRGSALVADQKDMAKSPVILSEPSEWTEPVTVLDDQYYFITNASEADDLGAARATAEVYRFFYGYYRKAAVSIEPGDMIVASIRLPDPAKLPLYEIQETPSESVTPPSQPTIPAPMAPRPGKGGMPGGDGGGLAVAPTQPQQTQPVALPENAKPWPTQTISARCDAILLDVAAMPGASDRERIAYLRGEGGDILIRVPDAERQNPVYNLVSLSAREGENQGQPREVTQPKPAQQRQPRQPREQMPRNTPGSGGGGEGAG